MRFYTADTHFGHKRIIELSNRPFNDVDEMNHRIINNINQVAGPDDELWILGDMAMGTLVETLELIKLINPSVHLVNGNHDRTWRGAKEKDRAKTPLYIEAGIQSIQDEAIHNIDGIPVRLSHFPYAGDHTEEDRHVEWRPADDGMWLLCGHVHELWGQQGMMINVGVDVRNFCPISEEDVLGLIRRGALCHA